MTTDPTYLATIDDGVVRRFEAAWRAGQRPAVEEYLPPAGRLYLPTLEELVHIDIEFSWKAAKGEQPTPVEEYLRRFPALDEPEILRRLVRQEIELRSRKGERPDVTEYEERFPSLRLDTIVGDPSTTAAHGPAVALNAGDQLGRYRLSVQHARGGFGFVWRAEDAALGREVALKQLSLDLARDDETRRRFLAEARVAARLQHPGVVPVYDVAESESEHPYYTMKLVSGQTLTEAIRRFHEKTSDVERSVEQLRLLNAFIAVVRTVAFAHSRGVIHRDLKPDNIILGDYGESVLLDWGLAKVKQEAGAALAAGGASDGDIELTQQGTLLGTPAYMSPEQANCETELVDERSDIHALGIILYQLLTGKRPFPGQTLPEVLKQVREHAPVRPRDLRAGLAKPLEAIALKAMAKKREDRYGDAADMARDLERFLADEPVTAYPEGPREWLARWSRRHRTAVVAGSVAGALSVLALLTGFFLWRDADQRRRQQQQARVAEIGTTAASAEEFGLAEMRRGRYASAVALFDQAARTAAQEPKLASVSARLEGRLGRARGVVTFYEALERGEENALHENDRQALGHLENALAALGLLEEPNWVEALPAEELVDHDGPGSDVRLRELREEVYRALVLRAALYLKLAFMKDVGQPEVQAALRKTMALMDQTEKLRPSLTASLGKAYCHFKLNELKEANAIKRVPLESASDFYFSGMAHLWVVLFPNNAIAQEMQNPFVRLRLSQIGFDYGRARDVAVEHLRLATDHAPTHFWGRLWLAWCLGWRGEHLAAAEAYGACVALRPDNWLGYGHRGQSLAFLASVERVPAQRKQLEARALGDLDRAIALEPFEPDPCWLRYRSLVALGRADAAFADMGRVVDRQRPLGEYDFQPLKPHLVELMGEILLTAGRRVLADRKDAEAWSVVAGAQQLLGKSDQAILAADDALKLSGNHVRALTVRGQAKLTQKRYDAALADFVAALTGNAGHLPAALGRGKALEALNRHEEALAVFDAMLQRPLGDWYRGESHLGRARALHRLGRSVEARAAVEAARPYHPQGAAETLTQLFP